MVRISTVCSLTVPFGTGKRHNFPQENNSENSERTILSMNPDLRCCLIQFPSFDSFQPSRVISTARTHMPVPSTRPQSVRVHFRQLVTRLTLSSGLISHRIANNDTGLTAVLPPCVHSTIKSYFYYNKLFIFIFKSVSFNAKCMKIFYSC